MLFFRPSRSSISFCIFSNKPESAVVKSAPPGNANGLFLPPAGLLTTGGADEVSAVCSSPLVFNTSNALIIYTRLCFLKQDHLQQNY